ncbi:MAG TPA: hypothetical protein V6C97_05835 [Oculatellaceae cyanobacterium]
MVGEPQSTFVIVHPMQSPSAVTVAAAAAAAEDRFEQRLAILEHQMQTLPSRQQAVIDKYKSGEISDEEYEFERHQFQVLDIPSIKRELEVLKRIKSSVEHRQPIHIYEWDMLIERVPRLYRRIVEDYFHWFH